MTEADSTAGCSPPRRQVCQPLHSTQNKATVSQPYRARFPVSADTCGLKRFSFHTRDAAGLTVSAFQILRCFWLTIKRFSHLWQAEDIKNKECRNPRSKPWKPWSMRGVELAHSKYQYQRECPRCESWRYQHYYDGALEELLTCSALGYVSRRPQCLRRTMPSRSFWS